MEDENEFVEQQDDNFEELGAEPNFNELIAQVMGSMASIDIADKPEKWKPTLTSHGLGDFKLPKDLIMANLSPAEEYTSEQLFEGARTIMSNFRWKCFRKQAVNMIIDATIQLNLTRARYGMQQKYLINITGNAPRTGDTPDKVQIPRG